MVVRRFAIMGASLLAVVLVGCGGTSAPVKKLAVEFRSPALGSKGTIPAGYKCNGTKIWLPLQWGALPTTTKEVVIYMARFAQPEIKPGSTATARLIAQQLILGLKPELHQLATGRLPKGALIGAFEVNNKKTSICPKGAAQGVLFGIYALPHSQNLNKGPRSGNFLNRLRNEAVGVGTFIANGRA